MKKTKVIIPLICIIGLMLLIFYFSSQNGIESHRLSKGVVKYLKDLFPFLKDINGQAWGEDVNFDFLIRKLFHFCAYFILALLAFAVSAGFGAKERRARNISLVVCFLYSVSDEFHQIFISGRTSTIMDVFIDNCGSIAAMMVLLHFLKKRRMVTNPG